VADSSSDARLVEGLRRGDAAAFDEAYARYRAPLFGFLARLSGRRELAEDLLQETWFRLARHAFELEPETRLGAWLFTVARNLYVSHRRWLLLDRERLRELSLWPTTRPESPFERLAATETERRLERAISELSFEHREALLLGASNRFSAADAALIVGIEPDAFRQRLARARAALAAKLARSEKERP
jgi:RNA polymerase sigma-70 factor (ECF subfamily)